MLSEIDQVIQIFHKELPINYELKEIWSSEDDSRWVLFVTFETKQYVINLASNAFTTSERVNGWPAIIESYRQLGYYSPAMYPSRDGHYAESFIFKGKNCVVWEEEFARYPLCETLDPHVYTLPSGRYVYHDEVIAFLGKVGELHLTNFPFASGYVRFAPFEPTQTTDEIMECVANFDATVHAKAPAFLSRWERILALFHQNQAQLQELYPSLPTSVFQADPGKNNLLLDSHGHFKGFIDYNLAGCDTVLNIFLSTILFGYSYQRKPASSPDVLPELNAETQDSIIAIMLDTLRSLRTVYTFSEVEIQAAPLLFKYINCIGYAQLGALQKYASDPRKLNLLFDFMETQLLRNDIDFATAMKNDGIRFSS